jgi:GT2 family glycosyltransferase
VAPRLAVVIVNYCQWPETARLVRQLRASRAMAAEQAEVVVVDNHSPPNRLMSLLRRWPGVSLRRWGRNRGFARAVNEGCRLSRGDWFLLLNPDVSVTDGFLDEALAFSDHLATADHRAGIVGFRLANRDGSPQLSCGPFPRLAGTLARLVLPRARRKYCTSPLRQRCRVPWVTGCCLLVRRDCLQDLGGFDEDFFLYYEDVDLCQRARARGWSVWYEPALRVVHHEPLHQRAVSPHLRLLTRHSLLTYGLKHWAGWQVRLLASIVQVEAWLRRSWARWQGDARAAGLFVELGLLAGELANHSRQAARRRLRRVVQHAGGKIES